MSSPVKLYVYDLSNGLARQLSLQLTGKQLDGIWHTSVVVYDKEIFYGQGICITNPGQSHHGQPLKVIDMGFTDIDSETFEEYLSEMRRQYTADKYHLLDFNCNSFTNDVVGFLTGGSNPAWITDLPSDFLSTPFGAALRPTIDNMFRAPGAPAIPSARRPASAASALSNPQLASTLLEAFSSRATQPSPYGPLASSSSHGIPATSTLSAPMQICTNPSSFASILGKHRAVIAFFTSAGCPPCRTIEPVFENLAHAKTENRTESTMPAFVKVDLGVGMGSQVGAQYSVRVTPTFVFILDGKKVHEMKGADSVELRTQVDLLLFQAYPPHPHSSLPLPAVEAISLNPILFTQVPALDPVFTKLRASIADAPSTLDQASVENTLSNSVAPYLHSRAALRDDAAAAKGKNVPASSAMLSAWTTTTASLASALPSAQLFPLLDLWRLALLDPTVCAWLAATPQSSSPLGVLLAKASEADAARNTVLLGLRLAANALGTDALARGLCGQQLLLDLLVPSLLHESLPVRTAAASVAFNAAAFIQRGRVQKVRAGVSAAHGGSDGDWEVELTSAVVEAIRRETESEDVVHRLTASLAFILRLSPIYGDQLSPLLEVLQAKQTLEGKLAKGGCGEAGVQKADVRKLIQEVSAKLCP